MHTPTKQQFQEVIGALERVVPMAKRSENFDMMEGYTMEDGLLYGTTHCIGGWYAISHHAEFEDHTITTYKDGALKMAKTLGFTDIEQLLIWARDNPDIWGNHRGYHMFSSECAYGDAKTLAQAVKHLKKVQSRLPQ